MTPVNPILFWAPAVLLLPVLAVAAYFYLSLRVELRLLARHVVTRVEADGRWKELVIELETLRAQIAALDTRSGEQERARRDTAPGAVNLNRRGQILRLHGKGRNTAEIAADLQISQGEVELLLKVHDWTASSPL